MTKIKKHQWALRISKLCTCLSSDSHKWPNQMFGSKFSCHEIVGNQNTDNWQLYYYHITDL